MKAKAKNKKSHKNNNSSLDKVKGKNSRKFVISTLFIGLLALAIYQINFDALLPIKKIRAQGEFENVTEKMILDAISDDVDGGYLRVNVHKLQLEIEQLAWVKEASVRRVWPDSVVVTIKEQKAHAYWKNTGLLNESGEYFEPKNIATLELPILSGPKKLNVKVMNIYKDFKMQLDKVGLNINEINLDDRRAIYLELSNDIKISLGRIEYDTRLKRFISAYRINLKKYSDNIDYVDMRYTNGFSIKWKENTQAAKAENVLMGGRYV
jgi:cell division protein FtsQ